MTKLPFDYNPESGVRIEYEDTPEGFLLHYSQDSEPILDSNKAKQSAGREYYAHDPDMWRVASIPITLQYKWLIEEGIDVMNPEHWPAVRRKLNDPDYRYLKTGDIII